MNRRVGAVIIFGLGAWIMASNVLQAKLVDATKRGDTATVKRLLFCRVDPDTPLTKQFSAVRTAVIYNHAEELNLLLDAGGNPNTRMVKDAYQADYFKTVLLYAVEHREEQSVKVLLSHKADPKIGAGGTTPLRLARDLRMTSIADMLISAGATN